MAIIVNRVLAPRSKPGVSTWMRWRVLGGFIGLEQQFSGVVNKKSGRIRKGSGRGEVTADEATHVLNGVRMTDVPGLEEAHKEGLQEITMGGAMTEGSFTGDDGRAEGTFGMIIIRREKWIVHNCIAK